MYFTLWVSQTGVYFILISSMASSQFDILLDAILHVSYVIAINSVLYLTSEGGVSCRYCLLFYAGFKTITSIEDEKKSIEWLKFWVFYGILSFFCSYFTNGMLIKACVCGVLLLKFQVISFAPFSSRTMSF